MSDHKTLAKTPKPPQALGWMAEYADEHQLLEAARKVRDSGYTRTDAFTPFPVHGIDEALGIKPTVLPWFTLVAGCTGITVALVMEWWMNAIDYPYIISGKPFASWPAYIPVAFELTVLFSAFMTVFAMLGLNGLPRFSNPVFTNPRFDKTTDDRFFLWVDSRDKYFNSEKVQGLLEATGASSIEDVREDQSSDQVPKGILLTIFVVILLSFIPGAIVLNMRNAKSSQPRFHMFFDMDFQPARRTQAPTTIFADGRVQQPPVPGTIARGELGLSDPYDLGYDPQQTASLESAANAARLVSFQQDGGDQDGIGDAPGVEGEPDFAWITALPLPVDEELFALGRRKFDQNCAVCHGLGGYGDGLVSQRAQNLAQGYWLPPTSMHEQRIQQQSVGRLFYTVTHGKGKMGGYAASLNPRERWAVVLYVKALQRSQNAQPSDFPADVTLTSVDN